MKHSLQCLVAQLASKLALILMLLPVGNAYAQADEFPMVNGRVKIAATPFYQSGSSWGYTVMPEYPTGCYGSPYNIRTVAGAQAWLYQCMEVITKGNMAEYTNFKTLGRTPFVHDTQMYIWRSIAQFDALHNTHWTNLDGTSRDYTEVTTFGLQRVFICPVDYTLDTDGLSIEVTYESFLCSPNNRPGEYGKCPCAGNPVMFGHQRKREEDTDYADQQGLLSFQRFYDSSVSVSGENDPNGFPRANFFSLGQNWRSNFDRRLLVTRTDRGISVQHFGEDTAPDNFFFYSGKWYKDNHVKDSVKEKFDDNGVTVGWEYTVSATGAIEFYDTYGMLRSITERNGYRKFLYYTEIKGNTSSRGFPYVFGNDLNNLHGIGMSISPTPVLAYVEDIYGRRLSFEADERGRVRSFTDPAGNKTLYEYEGDNLSAVTRADGTTRRYRYNETEFSSAGKSYLLTGIIDENGQRFATWRYDGLKRPTSSEHGVGIDKYEFNYRPDPIVDVTNPLGAVTTYYFTSAAGLLKEWASEEIGVTPRSAVIWKTYDASGNLIKTNDLNGVVTTATFDPKRNLELTRVVASGTPSALTTTTEWYPQYDLVKQIFAPGKWTFYSRDERGNVVSLLEQSTDDPDGSKGVDAKLIGVQRVWFYSYDEKGKVLSVTGPRTDVMDVTNYSYDVVGNLTSVTNAAGHVTTFSEYDVHGRVGRVTDPNGVVSVFTYHPRGWIASKSIIANGYTETTSYEYDGVGQLKKVLNADGTQVFYSYDSAHRLISVADSLGNSIVYTLDNMNNRVRETVSDPTGTLTRMITRQFDNRGRLSSVTGGMQ